jgi:hypothetical protein
VLMLRPRRSRGAVAVGIAATLAIAAFAAAAAPATPSPAPSAVGERSDVRFTIGEAAVLEWIRAATPYTFSVGNSLLKVDLTLSDPRELKLLDSRATLKVRLRGSSIPVDQILQPVFVLRHDAAQSKYFVVVSSLPVALPGLGTIDLKDSFPKFEIPELVQDLWRFSDRPVALNLDIRRIAVLEHALEIAANVKFAPAATVGTRGSR